MPLPPAILGQPIPQPAIALWNRVYVWRSLAVLLLGSLWDVLTLSRIDRLSDQLFVLAYQLVFALTLVFDLRWRSTGEGPWWLHRFPNALHYVSQFALGGMLSMYCVYYFRGAASVRAVLYGGLLVLLLFANEYVHGSVRGPQARLAIFAFTLFNGLLFALPILFGWLVPASVAAVIALVVVAVAAWFGNPNARSVGAQVRQMVPAADDRSHL